MSIPTTLPLDEEPARTGTITLHETVALAHIAEAPGFNPRHDYGESDGTLTALVESVRAHGVLSPPLVVQQGDGAYLVVDGHRRVAAARLAGLTEIDCMVMTWQWSEDKDKALAAYTPEVLLSLALVANLQRREMNCIEIGEGIVRLEKLGKTQEEIAKLIGRTQGWVSKCARLLGLPSTVLTLLRDGGLTQSHGEELLPLLSGEFLPGEIDLIAHRAMEQGLTVMGIRNVVREKIERTKPIQTAIPVDEQEGRYSVPNTERTPEEDELDARIARTLAATKGLDKAKLGSSATDPRPAPKDTMERQQLPSSNGLTRKNSDQQFAAAMAPDEDVVPLSSLPAPGMWLRLEPETARMLMELCDWHREEHGEGLLVEQKLNDVVRSFHQAKLDMRIEAEAAKQAREATFPVFEESAREDLHPSLEDDAFLSAFWRCLANHGHEEKLLAFKLPTTRSTIRRFSEMLGQALGEAGGWGSPRTFGWVKGEHKGGPYPSVKLTYREGERSREFAFKSGDLLDRAEKAITWKRAEIASGMTWDAEPAPAPAAELDEPSEETRASVRSFWGMPGPEAPKGIAEGLDEFAGGLV